MYAVVVVVDGYMCVTTQRTFVVAAVTVVNAVGSMRVTTQSAQVLLLMMNTRVSLHSAHKSCCC